MALWRHDRFLYLVIWDLHRICDENTSLKTQEMISIGGDQMKYSSDHEIVGLVRGRFVSVVAEELTTG